MKVKQVVLDLDETLIHCFADLTESQIKILTSIPSLADRVYAIEMRDVQQPAGSGVLEVMYAVERPHLHQFLNYIGQRFERRIVWSAGQQDYVYRHVAHISRFNPNLFDMTWTYNDCVPNPDGLLTKPLGKLYNSFPDMNPDSSFIIDDRETAFSYDNPLNGMLIPAYDPTINDLIDHALAGTSEDTALLQIITFLEAQDEKELDVPTLTQADIFIPMNQKHDGIARVLPTKGNGDCFFNALVACVENSPVTTRLAVEATLERHLATNRMFRELVTKRGTTNLLSPVNLRLLLASLLVNDRELTDTILANRKIELDAIPSPEVNWLKPVFRNKEPDVNLFYKMLVDRTQYWGDQMAIDVLSTALNAQICVWIDDFVLFVAGEPNLLHIHLHVFKHSYQHYSGVAFLFDLD